MDILYIDGSQGISGYRLLKALSLLIDDRQFLIEEIMKLKIDNLQFEINQIEDYIKIKIKQKIPNDNYWSLDSISNAINQSQLSSDKKEKTIKIINKLIKTRNKYAFYQTKNAIKELELFKLLSYSLGSIILIDKINPDKIICGLLTDGYGIVNKNSYSYSIPGPVVTDLLVSRNALINQIEINQEMIDEIGAAIISEITDSFELMPPMKLQRVAYGNDQNTSLKIVLGQREDYHDDIIVLETNIDDTTGEVLGYTSKQLFDHGALDVFFTPIYMKKNRPAYRLTVACKEDKLKTMQDIIFKETTTIGMRYRKEQRCVLKRKIVKIASEFGLITCKQVEFNGQTFTYPEYEDVKKVAEETGLAFKDIYKSLVR